MEIYHLDRDIPVCCIQAESFPLGILSAHEKLHALIRFSPERNYFGISQPDRTGNIIYKAAAEEIKSGEANRLNLESMTLKQGHYLSLFIRNFHEDVQKIGRAFRQMIADPRIDPRGYCIEWYLNEQDVRCMVKIAEWGVDSGW